MIVTRKAVDEPSATYHEVAFDTVRNGDGVGVF